MLSFTIPEFLTGATPVLTFFTNPLSFLALPGLYGAGVLVIREVAVRWRKGIPTILLLGLVYGIAEEGFGVMTFFAPNNSAAGLLGSFGRLGGVDWVWVPDIAVFHAVFSVALPILLVGVLYPRTRSARFLSDRGLVWTFGIFALTVTALFLLTRALYAYTPSAPVLLLFLAISVVLVGIALRMPFRWRAWTSKIAPSSAKRVGLIGGMWVWLTFGIYWIGPLVVPVPVIVVILGAGFALWTGLRLLPEVDADNGRPRVALAAGMLSFLLVFSVIVTVARADVLAPLATASVIALLAVLWGRTGRGERTLSSPPPATLFPEASVGGL